MRVTIIITSAVTLEECIELIQYYLARDGERRAAVAQVGQRRALNEHTHLHRMQELQSTISRYC
jgi:spore maturation protein CgeB